MQLHFINGWVLFFVWGALALALAWVLLYRRRRQSMEAFLSGPMLTRLAPAAGSSRFYWQLGLIEAGLLLLIVASARPQWGMEERTVFQRGRDLIIALDVSRSMLARDVHPNRLQRAKADIQDLLRELHGDRVALLTFRGRAIQLCPLTTDYAYLEQILDDVTIESAPRGETNIGDAVEKALTAFENDVGAHRAMVLISDGEDLAGGAKAAAEKAKKNGIVVFTVGLGDPQGAKIPGASKSDPYLTYQGKEVVTRLQHETLKDMAEITGGAYVPVGVANVKLGKLYRDHLSKIAARDIEESLQQRMIDRFQFFLLPGVIALLAGALLSRGRLARRRRSPEESTEQRRAFRLRSNKAGSVLKANLSPVGNGKNISSLLWFLFLAFPYHALAQTNQAVKLPLDSVAAVSNLPPRSKETGKTAETFSTGRLGASRGQQLYRKGAYRRAASAYLHAVSNSSPRLQNDCFFNAGCAFYRAGDYAEAVDSFTRLDSRGEIDQAKAGYNLGCATYRLAEQADKIGTNRPPELKPMLLEKAGQAFQRALRANPEYEKASANLAVITNMLPKAREDAKVKSLMAKYGGWPPSQIADTLLQNQRNILKTLPETLTNATPARITQFETLAAQQRDSSDLLIPLKLVLANAITAQGQSGQQQLPQLEQHLEAMQNSMNEGFEGMRNIDNRSVQPVKNAERGIYNLWKGLAPFGQLLSEDIRRQTNAIVMTASGLGDAETEVGDIKEEQNEAHQLTRLFTERFKQAMAQNVQQGATKLPGARLTVPLPEETENSATNETQQISKEAQTNILYLAGQAVATQARAEQYLAVTNLELSLPEQRRSYDLLKEIEKLLPKDKNQQPKQDQQNQQQQNQDKNQDQKEDNKQPPPPQEQPPPPQDQKPQQPKEQSAEPEQKDQKEMTPEQLRALLEKALQREKEHREDKMRNEYIPPSPVERDW